jgi:hypothetical protein
MIFPGLILICKIIRTTILYIAFVWRLHAVSEELANISVDQLIFELDTRFRQYLRVCGGSMQLMQQYRPFYPETLDAVDQFES